MVRKVSEILAEEQAGTKAAPTAAAATAKPVRKVAEIAADEEKTQPGALRRAGGALLDAGLKTAAFVGRQVDRVSGAPIRQGLSDAMDVAQRDPERNVLLDLPEGLAAFAKGAAGQFGRDPNNAPSSHDLAVRGGVSDEPGSFTSFGYPGGQNPQFTGGQGPSPADVAGFVGDVATPIPGLGELKAVGAMAKPVSKMAMATAEGAAKAADAATGTKAASKAVGGVKTAIKALENSYDAAKEGFKATFGAKQADDYAESVATAVRNNIDPKLLPEAVEFGPSSIVTRTARVQAEGPLGQPLLEKFTKAQDEVRGALQRDVEKIAGGTPLSKPQAGEVLREGFNAGVQRAFDDIEAGHMAILDQAPDLVLTRNQLDGLLTKLVEMENWGKAKLASGVTNTAKGQGRQILRAVENVKKTISSGRGPGEVIQAPYSSVYSSLKEIGDVAFKKAPNSLSDVPPDLVRFRKLYGDLNEALIGTVEEAMDAGAAKAIRDANAAFTKIYGDKGLLGRLGEKAASGEELFSDVIQHGSTKEIQTLKGYLTPEQLQTLKGTFLHDLIKLDPEGKFTFRATFNRLRDKADIADALFEPGEIDNFLSLLKLGDKFGHPVMSTSGTGASGAFREFLSTAKNRAVDEPIAQNIKQKARAIGFDINEMPNKAAAQNPGRPPMMSLSPEAQRRLADGLGSLKIRSRAARAYAGLGEDDQE